MDTNKTTPATRLTPVGRIARSSAAVFTAATALVRLLRALGLV